MTRESLDAVLRHAVILGTLAVLKQLEWAARDGRQYLYLGYWIAGHAKMDYKRRFQPLEGFDGRGWRRLQA